jgi:hypothetical protein
VAPSGLLKTLARAAAEGVAPPADGGSTEIHAIATAMTVSIPIVGEPTPLVVSG